MWLLRVSRPRFWMYTAGPYLLGAMIALPTPRNFLLPAFWLPFLYYLVPANGYIYGINDLFDRVTDRLNARPGEAKGDKTLTDGQARTLSAILGAILLLDLLILVLLPDWPARIVFGLFVALCTFYSAPPVRFKARPFFDCYSNVLYVLPGYLGYYAIALRWPPVPVLIAGGLWAAGMHAYSALPDIEPDSKAGIATVATALGERRGLLFVTVNWLAFAILIVLSVGAVGLPVLVYPLIPLALYVRPGWSVARAYRCFPLINIGFGFYAFVMISLIG